MKNDLINVKKAGSIEELINVFNKYAELFPNTIGDDECRLKYATKVFNNGICFVGTIENDIVGFSRVMLIMRKLKLVIVQ